MYPGAVGTVVPKRQAGGGSGGAMAGLAMPPQMSRRVNATVFEFGSAQNP